MEAPTLQNPETTLLIVDDDPLMTELFRVSMSRRGFRVLTACGGREALGIVQADDSAVRLVVTDVTMPEMDGLELARELGRVRPDLPVLLSTGHDADMEVAAGLPNVLGIVNKPYQARDLAERIRAIVACGPAES
ncbi:MAG TPA: response regulator [Chthonomonadaceae bacterium]|nr:response regulator [Chthonomonadaceae bacterium]